MNSTLSTIFRDFKRHYHKARAIADGLASKGTFKLQVKFDGSNLQAEYKSPDNEETVRLVVLMRRFLSPSDSLYYQKTWATLQEQFAQEIPADTIIYIETIIGRLKKGHLGLNINGEELTAEKIYQLLSDGEYFDNNEDAHKYLQGLAGLPIAGPLFWPTKAKCIFCLTTSAIFSSEEHVFPEALGNDELVLPKGYVCDRCNNGVLARLDEALTKFEPVAMLQVQFVPYTKDGKLPKANFQNLSMERTSPRNITIKDKDKTGRPKNKKHLGDDWYSFSVEIKGKKFNPKLLGRALYKIALEMVALSQGHEQACNPKFDAARNFILHGNDFSNNLLMCIECTPHAEIRVAYINLPEGTPFEINIYGLMFILNLECKPMLELNEVLTQAQYAIYPLRD